MWLGTVGSSGERDLVAVLAAATPVLVGFFKVVELWFEARREGVSVKEHHRRKAEAKVDEVRKEDPDVQALEQLKVRVSDLERLVSALVESKGYTDEYRKELNKWRERTERDIDRLEQQAQASAKGSDGVDFKDRQ
jgi:hypothetical protein